IAAQRVDVEVEEVEAGPVEVAGPPASRDGHADAVGDALAERAPRALDPRYDVVFGVGPAAAAKLAGVLDVVERPGWPPEYLVVRIDGLDAGEVQQGVEERRRVAGREHEAVSVGPDRVTRVEAQEALPQAVRHRRHAHGGARMAGLGLLDGVDAEGANRVDAEPVEVVRIVLGHGEPSRAGLYDGRPAVAHGARAGDELGSEPDAPQSACPGESGQTMASQYGNDHGEMLAVYARHPLRNRHPSTFIHGVNARAIPDSRNYATVKPSRALGTSQPAARPASS